MRRSSCGLRENIAAGLVALLGGAGIFVVLFLEKESYLVRFNAFQSLFLMLIISLGGSITCGILSIVGFIVWIISVVKAFKGELYEAPVVGKWAHKILS